MNLFESVFRLPHAPHNNGQKYYICARRDNGFVPAYRAYFYIKGNKVKKIVKKKIKKIKSENLKMIINII